MEPDEIPEIEIEKQPTKHWKATPEIEDAALLILKAAGNLPIKLRANDQRLEEFYEKGRLLYKSGRYKQAKDVFEILAMGRPDDAKYKMGIAACFHMLKEYDNAIIFYGFSAMLDP